MDLVEAAHQYLATARQMSTSGMFAKAFDFYMLAFDKCPAMREPHEEEFRLVMSKLNEILVSTNKMEDIFINFSRVLETFHNNTYFLNEIGKYLYKYAFYQEALFHFHKALRIDPGLVNAEKNLNSLKNLLVERWHFRMLNDKIRNESYKTAIHESLIPIKDSVLDLGTGTGLLAMYANERRPMGITACDGSEVMSKMADIITLENGYDQIIVVNKISTTMNYKDIGGKRSLVFTEMFDAGLFGENVLETMSHAWQYLISKGGRVIPNKAEFFVVGAKCDFLSRKYQLCSSTKSLLNIPTLNIHVLTDQETYDSEDVHLLGEDVKYLTEPQSVVKIDFNSLHEIQDALKRTEPYEVELNVTGDGEINIYIGWFNLYLTENVTITTDPRSKMRANAWQQAVFYDNIPKTVKENDIVDVEFLMNGGKLTMLPEFNSHITRISPETVRFLNDLDYINVILGCIGMACVYLGQITNISQTNIIDFCPFPMFGLQLLKRGIQSLICHAKTSSDKHFFKKVFKANDIPLSKVTILVGDDWSLDVFRDEKYHAIFCNVFELCGEIDLQFKDIAEHLKQNHLIQGGLFMPANIKLMCQVVDSQWIDINNWLFDKNVHNYKIAEFINKYQVTQNFCIDLSHLNCTPLSEPCLVGTYNGQLGTEIIGVSLIKDGKASAVLCWYVIELMEDLTEISTYRKYSFIDGLAFIVDPKIHLRNGDVINLVHCVDPDGSFKILLEDVS